MTTLESLDTRLARMEKLLTAMAGARASRPWVPASEAARRAGMARTTFVRGFVDTGKVRSRKSANGRLLVRVADLEEADA